MLHGFPLFRVNKTAVNIQVRPLRSRGGQSEKTTEVIEQSAIASEIGWYFAFRDDGVL